MRAGYLAILAFCALALTSAATPSHAQTLNETFSRPADPNARLFVELGPSSKTIYDRKNDVITLIGDVKLYYDGRTLEADKIVYDRKAKRVVAEGNAHVTEADGTKYYSDRFELTDDFRDGFVEHFRGVTSDNQRFSAARAERTDGEQTVFERGIYTPCLPCAENPEKAPLWQVKAKKMIAKNSEQMLYFEDAQLEFWGVPVAFLPIFSMPDPSVRRKSGFLSPSFVSRSGTGFGISTPYFFNLAPNYDITFTPTFLSRQGVLLEAEWRHRLSNGSYDFSLAGIYQLEPDAFADPPNGAGDRDFRGRIRSRGSFAINEKWRWGWAASISTDRFFYRDYGLDSTGVLNVSYLTDAVSTLYLTGKGERSWFDLRGYYFQALNAGAIQDQIPVVLPALEYDRKFETPFGAEFGFRTNFVALRREKADFDRLTLDANANPVNGCLTSIAGDCSLARGASGNSMRFNTDLTLRKSIIDPIGQVWTPFAVVNASMSYYALKDDPTFNTQQEQVFGINDENVKLRFMPTVGIDYRYPFFADTSFGTHVFEPIAQIIASPNETDIGAYPNEDAQSLSFDDTNLFEWNKFSGNDRQEGGVRANVGLQYTWNLPNGGWFNLMGGRSFHLAGKNSFASGDASNTGLDSGLDRSTSDYVARATLQPIDGVSLTTRGRFDADTFEMKRIEGIADFKFQRLSASATYARFEPQPRLGYDLLREGLALNASVKVTEYWKVFGGAVFDLDIGEQRRINNQADFTDKFQIASAALGIGYEDECTTFTATWTRSNSIQTTGAAKTNDVYMVRLDLKNLGGIGYTLGNNDDVISPLD
jgi:LPS-assembly protein